MTVLYFNDVDLGVAQALATATKQPLAKFDLPEAFGKLGEKITLVSPTELNETTMGGKTPVQLADAFAEKIPEKNRKKLKDVYLIAPEAGMSIDKPSFAQDFSREMAQRQFSKVSVYAIANPGSFPIKKMKMSITLEDDTESKKGHLQAWIFENDNTALGVLSTGDYQGDLKQKYNTFTSTGPTVTISPAASFAINFLQAQDHSSARHPDKRKKQLEKGIKAIQKDPTIGIDQIIALLKGGRSQKKLAQGGSTFCTDVVNTLEKLLRDKLEPASITAAPPQGSTLSMMQSLQKPAAPAQFSASSGRQSLKWSAPSLLSITTNIQRARTPLTTPDGLEHITPDSDNSLQVLTDGQNDTQLNMTRLINRTEQGERINDADEEDQVELFDPAFLRDELVAYQDMRQNEWWGFHYNILGIMSVIYYITDALTGTDHFNSKSRDVKISATTKLIELLDNNGKLEEDFTDSEKRALSEGRLGEKLAPYGGLEAIGAVYSRPQVLPATGAELNMVF